MWRFYRTIGSRMATLSFQADIPAGLWGAVRLKQLSSRLRLHAHPVLSRSWVSVFPLPARLTSTMAVAAYLLRLGLKGVLSGNAKQ